jgi:hypothetical protein
VPSEGESPQGCGGVHDPGDAGVDAGLAECEEQVRGGVGDQRGDDQVSPGTAVVRQPVMGDRDERAHDERAEQHTTECHLVGAERIQREFDTREVRAP